MKKKGFQRALALWWGSKGQRPLAYPTSHNLSLPHRGLDLLNGARDIGGQVNAAVFCHETVVLEPEADAPLLAVDADIYAEDHPR